MAGIHEAIVNIMRKGYAIGKDKRNDQQHFKYRGIDDVMNVFQPLMADAGMFVVPEVVETKREERITDKGKSLIYAVLKVKYTFFASDGSSVEAVVIGEGMDLADKASNKAMAAAMKYAMFQVFCIPTEEMRDPDAETPPESIPMQRPEPEKIVCECCGNEIRDTVDRNGKRVSARRIADGSIEKFGKAYCTDCIAKGLHQLYSEGNEE